MTHAVLTESAFRTTPLSKVLLAAVGAALITAGAKISVPMWPVPMTFQTFAVLIIGAAYGPGLGLLTVVCYLALGAVGINVFAGDGSQVGIAYMLGGTGGYLVGFAIAAGLLGMLARRGWDRSVLSMAGALILGNMVIYVPGLLWLGLSFGWDKPILAWGLWPFLLGDALKLLLAALLVPALWRAIRHASLK